MYNSKISGLGFYLPDNIVTNNDLEKIMDTKNSTVSGLGQGIAVLFKKNKKSPIHCYKINS